MASESETWWSQHYTVYSIRDLQALPIFNRFISMHYPFERSSEDRSESFESSGSLDVYQWTATATNEGEKFTHDRTSDLWHYEHRFQEKDAHATVRTWLSPEAEWGEVERKFAEFVIHENWKLQGSVRHYERYSLQGGEKRGLKTGRLPAQGGYELWTETYWEREGESEFEKVWERPGSSGGENKHNRGDYWWGEVWHKSGDHIEKKAWHTRGDQDWGHVHGEACGKIWDEKWDISKGKRSEEKLTQDGDRRRGFRYLRVGPDWYKQEWDGLSILGVDEGVEQLKKAEVRQDLDEISSNSHDTLLKGEHTLELLLREAPHFAAEVEDLKNERIAISKPDSGDVDALITAIRAERELADKQERLKQRIIDDVYADHGRYLELHVILEKLLAQSHGTLKQIALALKDDPDANRDAEEWGPKIEELRKRRNVSSFGKDLLYTEALEDLERRKRVHIDKQKGGIPKEEVSKAMDLLYQIMVKHDAVSDKIVELVPDVELKGKLDGFEDQFETIHKQYHDEADPHKLHENLSLLLDYQPIHLHLIGRLRGYNKDEVTSELGNITSAVEETKSAPSLKNTRAKVRSGRGAKDTPFQLIDRNLNRLIPFIVKVNESVRGKEDLEPLVTIGKSLVDDGQPFEVILKKADLLISAAVALEPKIDAHEGKLSDLDHSLDEILSENNKVLAGEDLSTNEALLARHYPSEDVELLQEKLSRTGETNTAVFASFETQITELTENVEELESIIEQKSEEITYITKLMDEKDKRNTILEEDLAELRRYKSLFEDRDNRATELEIKEKKLNTEIGELRLRLEAALQENHELKEKLVELEAFRRTSLEKDSEIVTLKGIIKQYEEMLGDRKAEFQEVISNMNTNISTLEARIKALEAQIADLKQQLELKDNARKKELLLRLTFALKNTLKTERFSLFLNWRNRANEPPEVLSEDIFDQVPEVKATVLDDEQEFTPEEVTKFLEAEKPLLEKRKGVLATNALFKHLRASGLKFEPAQPLSEFYQLAEEVLAKKFEADNEDIANKRYPANLAGFILDYLLHTKGVKRLAQRDLLRFIPTLHRLYHNKSPYGTVLARLLHVFHSNPVSGEGAVLTLRYNQEFKPLAEKYQQTLEPRQVTPESEANLANTGGEARLSDVLNEFFPRFKEDDIYLWHFLRHLRPSNLAVQDYVLAVIHWYAVSQLHQSEVWRTLAQDRTELDQQTFLTRVLELGLHLSPRILKEAFKALAINGVVKEEIFTYSGKDTSEQLLVSKGAFLTAIIEANKSRVRRNALKLNEQFSAHGVSSLDEANFGQLVKVHDGAIPAEALGKLHSFAVSASESTPIDLAGFESALVRYPAGTLSRLPLHVPELLYLFDPHVFEFDLETGVKTVEKKTTTRIVTTKTTTTRTVTGRKV